LIYVNRFCRIDALWISAGKLEILENFALRRRKRLIKKQQAGKRKGMLG
jgi:hypothetical protein